MAGHLVTTPPPCPGKRWYKALGLMPLPSFIGRAPPHPLFRWQLSPRVTGPYWRCAPSRARTGAGTRSSRALSLGGECPREGWPASPPGSVDLGWTIPCCRGEAPAAHHRVLGSVPGPPALEARSGLLIAPRCLRTQAWVATCHLRKPPASERNPEENFHHNAMCRN